MRRHSISHDCFIATQRSLPSANSLIPELHSGFPPAALSTLSPCLHGYHLLHFMSPVDWLQGSPRPTSGLARSHASVPHSWLAFSPTPTAKEKLCKGLVAYVSTEVAHRLMWWQGMKLWSFQRQPCLTSVPSTGYQGEPLPVPSLHSNQRSLSTKETQRSIFNEVLTYLNQCPLDSLWRVQQA